MKRLKVLITLAITVIITCFATPVLAQSQNEIFLQKLQDYTPEEISGLYGGIPDESKIEAAQFACQAFRRGIKLRELNLLGLQRHNPSKHDLEFVSALAQAATTAYCPDIH